MYLSSTELIIVFDKYISFLYYINGGDNMTSIKDARLVKIGQRLKAFRKNHGYKSQESFALDVGSTRAAIASYELGRVEPTGAFLHALSTKFGADINYILTGRSEQDMPDIDAYLTRMGIDEMAKTIIKSYMALPPDKRKIVKDYIDSLAAKIVANKSNHTNATYDTSPQQIKKFDNNDKPDGLTDDEWAMVQQSRTAKESQNEVVG